jgi:hypothetical protein
VSVSVLQLLSELGIDTSKFELGLEKAEKRAEETASKISGKFGLMAVGIATALAGTVLVALEQCIKKTAEYGLEMEHLGNRLGMTAQQAAVLTGVLEKQGLGANVAARAFQIMASGARQTGESLDPLSTKLGKVLGTLRDSNGQLLNTAQIFDLARNKIQGAATATEQLQLSQQIFGARMGGQLLPALKMSNEEWERQKEQVSKSLGPVNEAAEAALKYKAAMTGLEQGFRGVELEIGTKLLPTLSQWINDMQGGLQAIRDWSHESKVLHGILSSIRDILTLKQAREGVSALTETWLKLGEAVHLYDKGTADNFKNMAKWQEESANAAMEVEKKKLKEKDAQDALAAEVQLTEKVESQLVKIAGDRVKIKEKEVELGKASPADVELAVQEKLLALEEQKALLQKNFESASTEDQKTAAQEKLLANELATLEVVAEATKKKYKDEEAQLKSIGALNLATEIGLLEKKLQDERTVGNERLKIEGDLYEKRKQFAEESMKVARDLGVASVDDELAYRKKRAAQMLGSGDVIGAGQELKKMNDLAMKQADELIEYTKKIRVVSIAEEIDFQRQKLAAVRGNAEQEMKIIGQIADLDKQLYNQRLQYGLTYTQTIVDQYNKVMEAAQKSGDVQSFEQARVDSERKLTEATRTAGEVLHGGGTDEQRKAAVDFAQFVNKQIEQMQSLGKEVTGVWQDAASTAKDILKAASGGEEVRAPGGPSPLVGSLTSSVEGLATQGLAKGSQIPNLDTSFTDLAVRVRDVLLGVIPNVQNLSNAFASAAQKVANLTGFQLNPGIVGPGGQIVGPGTPGSLLPTGLSTPAPVAGVSGAPASPQQGGGESDTASAVRDLADSLKSSIDDLRGALETQADQNNQQIREAVASVQAQRAKVDVSVGIDAGTGDLMVSKIADALS